MVGVAAGAAGKGSREKSVWTAYTRGSGLVAVAALVLVGRRMGLVWTHGREW